MNAVVHDIEALMRMATHTDDGQRQATRYVMRRLADSQIRLDVIEVGRREVLVAEVGPPRGPVIAYIGHLDVVEPDQPLGEQVIVDDRVLGRGAADMKSAVAVGMQALRELAGRTRNRVRLVLVTDEEQTSDEHSFAAYARWHSGDIAFALALEATDLHIGVQSKGALRVRLHVEGISAHSARPHLGRNAIDGLDAVMPYLRRAPFLQAGGSKYFPEGATLERTTIQGGGSITAVPALCIATLDIRHLPDQGYDEILGQLEAAAARSGVPGVSIVPMPNLPAVATAPDDPYVRALAHIVEHHTGAPAVLEGRQGAADHAFLEGIPRAELGVVGGGVHGTDEWADVPSIGQLLGILIELPDAIADRREE